VLGWHASIYLCILLGCSRDVLQVNTGGGNSQNEDDELEGNNALDIHLNLPVMAYIYAGEILVGLTPKERDWVVHRVKQFQWLGNYRSYR
jgi:hypothetical protein